MGATMAESESMTHMAESQETSRGKSGKDRAVFKRNKGGPSSREAPESNGATKDRPSTDQLLKQEPAAQDPQVIVRIQQRAYWLYEAGGFEHGHDLEHWLEAERQITGSSERGAG